VCLQQRRPALAKGFMPLNQSLPMTKNACLSENEECLGRERTGFYELVSRTLSLASSEATRFRDLRNLCDKKTNAGRLTSKLGLSARHLLLRPLALLIDCYEERLEWKTHGIRGTVNISRTRLLNQSRRRIACLRNSRGESP
jgi:hypothetical protein